MVPVMRLGSNSSIPRGFSSAETDWRRGRGLETWLSQKVRWGNPSWLLNEPQKSTEFNFDLLVFK